MSDKLMSQKVTKVSLAFATLGIAGGAIFAGFLSNTSTETFSAEAPIQSISVESEIKAEISESEKVTDVSVIPEPVNNTKIISGEVVLELVEGTEDTASSTQKITNDSKNVKVTPAPSKSSGTSSSRPVETVNEPGLILGPPREDSTTPTAYCPASREENPTVYDACRAGFVAPTLEWAGYHSCTRVSEDAVEIYGLVRITGGNYAHISNTGPLVNGMIRVSSVNASSPYRVMWYVEVVFWSMDSRYNGIIHKVSANGGEFIEESQLDPSCRL